MEFYWIFVVFVFGAIIGSFLDVVAYRLHTAKSFNGRSHCLSCATTLRWYELIPVVSYVMLRARCRTCRARIPWRCLLMELATGSAFVLMWQLYRHDIVLALLYMVVASVLILIVAYDLRHMIIPDELVVILFVAAVAVLLYTVSLQGPHIDVLVAHGMSGVFGALFFASFWLVSKGKWMGLGDAKLMLPLGILLGPWATFSAIVFAFWTGAAISVSLLGVSTLLRSPMLRQTAAGKTGVSFLSRPLTIKHEIPFAPFIILGFVLVHFFHVDLFAFFPFYVW